MNEVSLKPVIEELEDLFSKFNTRFFADKLEKPVITVSPDHTRGAYGWCTGWKAWKAGEDEGHYEINLCAEYLNRPFEETCGTLIHEMVHLQNLQDGVQDTSRSGTYHNKKFKETAEAPGYVFQVFFWIAIQNQIGIAQWVIVDKVVQFRLLRHSHIQCILNPGAVDGNLSPIPEQQLHAAGVHVEFASSCIALHVCVLSALRHS